MGVAAAVDVDGVGAAGHGVGEGDGLEVLLPGEHVDALHVAGLPDPGLLGGVEDPGVPELREVLPQQGGEGVGVLPQAALRLRGLGGVRHVRLCAGHVHHHGARAQQMAEPGAAEGGHLPGSGQLPEEGLDALVVVVEALDLVVGPLQPVRVHAAQAEAQGGGLEGQDVLLHGHAHHGAQIPVAGAVDDVPGRQGLGAGLGVQDHVGETAVLLPAAGEDGVEVEMDPALQQHPLGGELIDLRIVGHVAQGLLHLRAPLVHHALDKLPGDAAADQLSAVDKDADGHHQSRRGHAAGVAVSLHEGGPRPHPGGRHRGDPAAGAAAADGHVIAARHGNRAGLL